MKKILDLGCGNKKKIGSIGIDINLNTDADIIHDLNIFPYPFKESTFDEIHGDNVIEHLDNVVKVMEELYRISKDKGIIIIKVPYFRSRYAYIDPTHKHFFTVDSFTYYDPSHIHHTLYNYSKCLFKTTGRYFDIGFPSENILKRFVKDLCNRQPRLYEHYFSHLFPLDELTFYLETIKDDQLIML
jgi:predicted SAM-dependent methyltransferase